MKKIKILRKTFLSVSVLFTLIGLLAAGTNEGVLNFENIPLAGHPPTYTSFDAPGAGTGPGQSTQGITINAKGLIAGVLFAL